MSSEHALSVLAPVLELAPAPAPSIAPARARSLQEERRSAVAMTMAVAMPMTVAMSMAGAVLSRSALSLRRVLLVLWCWLQLIAMLFCLLVLWKSASRLSLRLRRRSLLLRRQGTKHYRVQRRRQRSSSGAACQVAPLYQLLGACFIAGVIGAISRWWQRVMLCLLIWGMSSYGSYVWALPVSTSVGLGQFWEAGRLDYVYGGSEVAAFVNTPEQIQLQLVLCAHNEAAPYRLTVLLPHNPAASGIIPVKLQVDGVTTPVYAEIVDNSLEFQVGTNFLITLPDSPTFVMEFTKEDAAYLKIPRQVQFPMERAALALEQVAKSCTILCQSQDFSCHQPLIAGILWPRSGFNTVATLAALQRYQQHDAVEQGQQETAQSTTTTTTTTTPASTEQATNAPLEVIDLDALCLRWPQDSTQNTENGKNSRLQKHLLNERRSMVSGLVSSIQAQESMPSFVLTQKCRAALDQVYERTGKDALSFLHELFYKPSGHYQQYMRLWNGVVIDTAHWELLQPEPQIKDFDYYLALFSLFSNTAITQYPQSYYDILKSREDPSSFIYGIENRYELETVKYYAVLARRINTSLSLKRNVSKALMAWGEFYQEFTMALPPIAKAQALRPVIYRQMLMRIWRLAGYPETLHLRPENSFVHGSEGKTTTNELLEARCSVFEGNNGDQFFFASPACVQAISLDLRNLGLSGAPLQEVVKRWDEFATAWQQSVFYLPNDEDVIGEHPRSGLALALLSIYKTYGFGDYFLLRKCLSSRDSDICAYDADLNYDVYQSELRKTIAALSTVSGKDARSLSDLNKLWSRYYDSLCAYTNGLAKAGKIEAWRALFVQAVASTLQSETVLNAMFARQYGIDLTKEGELE